MIAKEWKKIFSSKFRMSLVSSLCFMICACSTNPASFNSQNNTGSSPRFRVVDGSIYDHDKKIFLKGVNWFGFDTEYLDLHGLWSGKSINFYLQKIKSEGFNAVRIPVSPEAVEERIKLQTFLEISFQHQIYVLIDIHNCSFKEGHLAAKPCDNTIPTLQKIAELTRSYSNVVGIDLFNEPHGLSWVEWQTFVEQAASALTQINPHPLIFVEGIGSVGVNNCQNYPSENKQCVQPAFWGEYLAPIVSNPLNIPRDRLVLSPHAYGPSVYDGHRYFKTSDFPANMPEIWDAHFGNLNGRYPLAIGEFGGRYVGNDKIWQDSFVRYLLDRGIEHFFYWSLNPNSGDTGGLLLDDWQSFDHRKLDLLRPLLDREIAGQSNSIQPQQIRQKHGTFYINNGRLFDPTGEEFIFRGINNAHAYYKEKSLAALDHIKDLGFNGVRIVWCADTLIRAGRCENKDVHSPVHLQEILAKMEQLKLVAVLNLQNPTGSNESKHLAAMTDYLIRDDIAPILKRYQHMLLLNVANEWYGKWDESRIYVETYKSQIYRIRQAGLEHVLLVDARGWGQDFSSIPQFAEELLAEDSNLMFSSHLYDVYSEASKVRSIFSQIREKQLPFIIGEFACDHYPYQPRVDCATIMSEASREDSPFGYIAWSYSGNSSELNKLDVVSRDDWKSLTPWGVRLVDGVDGVKQTSKEASLFNNRK